MVLEIAWEAGWSWGKVIVEPNGFLGFSAILSSVNCFGTDLSVQDGVSVYVSVFQCRFLCVSVCVYEHVLLLMFFFSSVWRVYGAVYVGRCVLYLAGWRV